MDQPLLRVKEAAHMLQVSKWTIYRWVDEGRLDATKIGGGSLRIFRSSVMALVEGSRTDPRPTESVPQLKIVPLTRRRSLKGKEKVTGPGVVHPSSGSASPG